MSNKSQVIYADLTDMVFADREQGYGAYWLRRHYQRYLLTGLAIASALALGLSLTASWAKAGASKEVVRETVLTMSTLPPPPPPEQRQEAVTPPPPPPPAPKFKTLQFVGLDPAPEEQVDSRNTMHEVDSLKLIQNFGADDIEGELRRDNPFVFSDTGEEAVPDIVTDLFPKETEFILVEEKPQPINIREIQTQIGYPQILRDANIQGTVIFRVLVDKHGNYQKHIIINSPHPLIDKAVEAHIHKLRFTPAIQGNRPIHFWVNIPFTFRTL